MTAYSDIATDLVKDHYINRDELSQLLTSYEERYPKLAKLFSIGRSHNGVDLWVMRITDNVNIEEPGEPKVKYVGNLHGNEPVGRQLLVYLIDYLLTNYGVTDSVTKLVDETDIYILPALNPDGYAVATEGDCTGLTGRGNAHDVDLNRNFRDQFVEAKLMLLNNSDSAFVEDSQKHFPNGNNMAYEPETEAVMRWILQNKFVLSGNIHGGTIVASYPFDDSPSLIADNTYSASPDDAIFQLLARTYADNHPSMHGGNVCSKHRFEETHGITNGNKWFMVVGKCKRFAVKPATNPPITYTGKYLSRLDEIQYLNYSNILNPASF